MSELTDRRHFSNSAAESSLSVAINSSATSFTLSSTTGFPAVPFTAVLDYQGAVEEVVLVTGLSGLTVTNCVRGYDGSAATDHSLGATFVHSLIAQDLDEANDHTSSTVAHGTTGAVVGTSDVQTLTNKVISSSLAQATATDPALKAQAFASGSAALLEGYDPAGTGLLVKIGRNGELQVTPNAAGVKPLLLKGAALQTANLLEVDDSAGAQLLQVHAKGRITHKPTDLAGGPAVKYVPPAVDPATYLALRNAADNADLLVVSTAGEITAARAWLAGTSPASDPLRFPADGSKFRVDASGNVAGNNLPSVRTADKGKLQQGDTFVVNFAGVSGVSGTLVFPTAFGAAPDFVIATVQAASNFDLCINWTGALAQTGVAWRVFQKDSATFTGSCTVHWFAMGTAP